MRMRFPGKVVLQLSLVVLFALVMAFQSAPALADSPGPSLQVIWNTDIQNRVTIGRTPILLITLTNPTPDPIRLVIFRCPVSGTSLVGESISQLPPSVIQPNTTYHTQQVFHAVSGGTTSVFCELLGVDAVTGLQVEFASPTVSLFVIPETRLVFDATSATKVATVGQPVYVMATYSNHGNVTFTNVQVYCQEYGNSLTFVSSRQSQSTLPPGQSGFVQLQWNVTSTLGGTADILCNINATDSSTGTDVNLPAPTIMITVK